MAEAIDTQGLDPYPRALYDAVISAVHPWIKRRMHEVTADLWSAAETDATHALGIAATEVSDLVKTELFRLLSTDVDDQQTNPLQVLRACVAPVTAALRSHDVPYPHRDQFEQSAMPNDVYAIGPLTWRDLSDDVHDAGINWGAYKAAVILSRRRAEGKISS